jgi:mannose-6-phosphate isomerase
MKPQVLPPNVLHHYYAGGPRIAAFRGLQLGDNMPEEWIGAVNTTFDPSGGRGLSRNADGTLVRDAIAANPHAWLGDEHVARFGADPGLLTKLLDAGERLPVQFHPGRRFAREALQIAHGKTEAWVVIEAEPGASVYVGFKEAVDTETVRGWIRSGDSDAMLAAMHAIEVVAGDAIFVPAGTPHAIGEGMLILELQEPSDLSVLIEWNGFALEEEGHLRLGWDRALTQLDRTGWDAERLAGLRGPSTGMSMMPAAADPYFRAERVSGGDTLDAGFSVLIGLTGEGELGDLPVGRGSTVLIPHAAGPLELSGSVEAVRCRPPDPLSGDGEW